MELPKGQVSTFEQHKLKNLNEVVSKTIQYKFTKEAILLEALTHPSLHEEHQNFVSYKTNQRLEFLGDSILNMVVSAILFKLFPDEDEGALARRKIALVCGSTVADVAKQIKLGDFLLMTENERNNNKGPKNQNNLEDGLEALIGAIYLDGGFAEVEAFVERYWCPLVKNMQDLDPPQDFRSALQELVQKNGLPLPNYRTIKQTGPKHNPLFTVSLSLKAHSTVRAHASTVKGAEQKAAKLMLDTIVL